MNASAFLPVGVHPTDAQIDTLQAFTTELQRMNERVNLISRETADEIWRRHIAHSLALAIRRFPAGSRIADWGTGGGLPAIPLSILFPDCRFVGVDSTRKKIQACRTMVRRLGLENCRFVHGRAEDVGLEIDYSVSRATAPLAELWEWHQRCVPKAAGVRDNAAVQPAERSNEEWPPALLCLKGGDLTDEIRALREATGRSEAWSESAVDSPGGGVLVRTIDLSDVLPGSYFAGKVIVHVTRSAP